MVTLGGKPVKVEGVFPKVGDKAPAFSLVNKELEDTTLANFAGKKKCSTLCPAWIHQYAHCLRVNLISKRAI